MGLGMLSQRGGLHTRVYIGMPARRWYVNANVNSNWELMHRCIYFYSSFLPSFRFASLPSSKSHYYVCTSHLDWRVFTRATVLICIFRCCCVVRAGCRAGGNRGSGGGSGGRNKRRQRKKAAGGRGGDNEPKIIQDARGAVARQKAQVALNAAPATIAADTVIFICERKQIFRLMSVTAVSQFTFWAFLASFALKLNMDDDPEPIPLNDGSKAGDGDENRENGDEGSNDAGAVGNEGGEDEKLYGAAMVAAAAADAKKKSPPPASEKRQGSWYVYCSTRVFLSPLALLHHVAC